MTMTRRTELMQRALFHAERINELLDNAYEAHAKAVHQKAA